MLPSVVRSGGSELRIDQREDRDLTAGSDDQGGHREVVGDEDAVGRQVLGHSGVRHEPVLIFVAFPDLDHRDGAVDRVGRVQDQAGGRRDTRRRHHRVHGFVGGAVGLHGERDEHGHSNGTPLVMAPGETRHVAALCSCWGIDADHDPGRPVRVLSRERSGRPRVRADSALCGRPLRPQSKNAQSEL